MDPKKHFASAIMDDSLLLRPLSPFRGFGRSSPASRNGDRASTHSTVSSDLDLGLDHEHEQQPPSCVTQTTSEQDCARTRFIVWAAVKRNACDRMSDTEKLECPLLRCRQRAPSHEEMLKHLSGCKYLALGEYWCYKHMRVERFDDVKCTRCLHVGRSSKRKKVMSMARNFFHSIGHKSSSSSSSSSSSKKAHLNGLPFDSDDTRPPSFDSPSSPNAFYCLPLDPNATELPSTEILEIDSIPILTTPPRDVTMDGGAINPQALLAPTPCAPPPPVPSLPELDSTMPPPESYLEWQPNPEMVSPLLSAVQLDEYDTRGAISKPTLYLTTPGLPYQRRGTPVKTARSAPSVPRSKGLSPSSSVRSTASTDTTTSVDTVSTIDSTSSMDSTSSAETNLTTASTLNSLVSPISDMSGEWSMASGRDTSMTSPVDAGMSTDMFFCPDNLHQFYSELPAEMPVPMPAASNPIASDPTFALMPGPELAPPYAQNIVDDLLMMDADPAPEIAVEETRPVETKNLVGAVWETLHVHVMSSVSKIQAIQGNPLANQLRSMSCADVAAAGLRTLRDLLCGRQPSSADDLLCLVHLVYSFSLVMHQQGAPGWARGLFLQSLSYKDRLPLHQQELYRQLVVEIWEPPAAAPSMDGEFMNWPYQRYDQQADVKGKMRDMSGGWPPEDALLAAARGFLDELEVRFIVVDRPPDAVPAALILKHLNASFESPFGASSLVKPIRSVLRALSREFGKAPSLCGKLEAIHANLKSGMISSIRRVELELLHAGRACLSPEEYFGNFAPKARALCDAMYGHLVEWQRSAYHDLGIGLMESMIPRAGNRVAEKPEVSGVDQNLQQLLDYLNCGSSSLDVTAFDNASPTTYNRSDLEAHGLPHTHTSPPSPPKTQSPGSQGSGSSPQQQQHRTAEQEQEQQSSGQKVEADACCEICGYRPKGDPQWFKGSMSKHKKLMHSAAPPKIYKCPFPGCTSQYKNRPDNLRQHQIEKNHWGQGEEGATRRPSKRKKVAADE